MGNDVIEPDTVGDAILTSFRRRRDASSGSRYQHNEECKKLRTLSDVCERAHALDRAFGEAGDVRRSGTRVQIFGFLILLEIFSFGGV